MTRTEAYSTVLSAVLKLAESNIGFTNNPGKKKEWACVLFTPKDDDELNAIWDSMESLSKKGIYFDVSGNEFTVEWSLDWSLEVIATDYHEYREETDWFRSNLKENISRMRNR